MSDDLEVAIAAARAALERAADIAEIAVAAHAKQAGDAVDAEVVRAAAPWCAAMFRRLAKEFARRGTLQLTEEQRAAVALDAREMTAVAVRMIERIRTQLLPTGVD